MPCLSYPNVNSENRDIMVFPGLCAGPGTQQELKDIDQMKLRPIIPAILRTTNPQMIPVRKVPGRYCGLILKSTHFMHPLGRCLTVETNVEFPSYAVNIIS